MYRDHESGGAYPAERAAALSGVPRSTVHYWARHDILVPSVSREKVKLWSFADLLKLRTIYWLRQPKAAADGRDIPASTMPKVRKALTELDQLELGVWDEQGLPRVLVDQSGHVFIKRADGVLVDGSSPTQALLPILDLIAPFSMIPALQGPDLLVPRPHLRIVPGKLAGSPHVNDTRIETQAIAALHNRGFDVAAIAALYPVVARAAITEAIDLESQLDSNLSVAA
jgi:uncharacterized protein (DUF433 family)